MPETIGIGHPDEKNIRQDIFLEYKPNPDDFIRRMLIQKLGKNMEKLGLPLEQLVLIVKRQAEYLHESMRDNGRKKVNHNGVVEDQFRKTSDEIWLSEIVNGSKLRQGNMVNVQFCPFDKLPADIQIEYILNTLKM